MYAQVCMSVYVCVVCGRGEGEESMGGGICKIIDIVVCMLWIKVFTNNYDNPDFIVHDVQP